MRVCDRCQGYLGDADKGSVEIKRRKATATRLGNDYSTHNYELCDKCVEKLHNKIDAFICNRVEIANSDNPEGRIVYNGLT